MKRTIIGKYLDAYFLGSENEAKKVYVHPKYAWQIWEVEDALYGYMCDQSEEEFAEQSGGDEAYWRGSEGTVLGTPDTPCVIHGKELNVWDDFDEDLSSYQTLLDYLNHMGISTETNLIAAFKDLAKWNNITVEELLNTYEGSKYEG